MKPLDDGAMELSAMVKKPKGLDKRILKMLSKGKGSSIFEVVKQNEKETNCAVDKEVLTAKDNEGLTLLHHAARCGQVDTVNLLLDNGADIDVQENNGFTALHFAVRYVTPEHLNLQFSVSSSPGFASVHFHVLRFGSLYFTWRGGKLVFRK